VVCEGYANRDDEWVLKGSCGVEYRLLLTEKGEEKYGSGSWWGGSKGKNKGGGKETKVKTQDESLGPGGWLFVILFVGVLILILYKMGEGVQNQPVPRRRRGGGGWGGWGGGPGGGGGDDPPPPYPGKYNSYDSTANAGQGWRPGFWSGAATGAAAGYMAGNRGNRQETREVPRSSGWFGGGGGSGNRNTNSGSSSSPSSSSSSPRYSSTGFGSTSRR